MPLEEITDTHLKNASPAEVRAFVQRCRELRSNSAQWKAHVAAPAEDEEPELVKVGKAKTFDEF